MNFKIEVLEQVIAPGKIWDTVKTVVYYVISHPVFV